MECPHCNTQVDEHDATGCMDAWVHESIFGWTADYVWLDPSKNTVGRWTHPVEEDYFGCPSLYSTYIEVAWLIVEEMRKKYILLPIWELAALGDFPLRICRAAIKSKAKEQK